MFMILTILFSTIIKGIRDILNSARLKTVIFPPATSGIYASLQQAHIIILKILNIWILVPLYLSRVVIIFAFPRSKSGIFDLILNPAVSGKHFETASTC